MHVIFLVLGGIATMTLHTAIPLVAALLLGVLYATRRRWVLAIAKFLVKRTRAKGEKKNSIPGYMERLWVIRPRADRWRTRWFNVSARAHNLLRSDNDRHLHDHPWWNISIPLEDYMEELPKRGQRFNIGSYRRKPQPADGVEETCVVVRKAGQIVFRKATHRHRIKLIGENPVWSLFIMGPWQQDWGFYVPNIGKIYWREYLNEWGTDT